jgi:hypothetical protein
MEEPTGALQPTGNSGFVDRDMVREIRTENWPPEMQKIEELALYECIDEAGRHWALCIDGAVYRAAMSAPIRTDLGPGASTVTQMNWWIEAFSPEHILMTVPGWPAEWEEGTR